MSEASYELVGGEGVTYLIVHDPHTVVYRQDGEFEGYALKGDKVVGSFSSVPDPIEECEALNLAGYPPLWRKGPRDISVTEEIVRQGGLA